MSKYQWKKNTLIPLSQERISQFQNLKENKDLKNGVFLLLNSNQTLHKTVPKNGIDGDQVFHSVFPGITKDEFYYELSELGTSTLITLCRKEEVHKWISDFNNLGIPVRHVRLGIGCISNIIEYLPRTTIGLHTNSLLLSQTLNEIQIIPNTNLVMEEEYNIGGEVISSNQLLTLAMLLDFTSGAPISNSLFKINQKGHEYYKSKRLQQRILQYSFIVLFVVVFINAMVYSHYYSEKQIVSSQWEIASQNQTKFLRLQNDVDQNEKLLSIYKTRVDSQKSDLVNQLTLWVPESVALDKITIAPLMSKIEKDEPIVSDKEKIIISGETLSTSDFREWIQKMTTLPFVRDVKINHFKQVPPNTTHFEIAIRIHL